MPKFPLTDEEAQQIAAALSSSAPMFKQPGPSTDPAVIARGQQLMQTTGCLNCHTLKLDNQFKPKPLADLAAARWQHGCLAEKPAADSPRPHSPSTPKNAPPCKPSPPLIAARSCVTRPPSSPRARRKSPMHIVPRPARGLPADRCRRRQAQARVDRLLLKGEVADKMRPWIEHRMPAFPARAALLAAGLAQTHGFPPVTPAEPPVKMPLTAIGKNSSPTTAASPASPVTASLRWRRCRSSRPRHQPRLQRRAPAAHVVPPLDSQSPSRRADHQDARLFR